MGSEATVELVARLRELDAARTKTGHGWWSGDVYHGSFGPVGDPQSDQRTTMVLDGYDEGMMDVWAGDRANDEDNRPLVCECGEPNDARFIAEVANALPSLLDTIESLRASLTRVEEERDEAVRALEPFAKARPTETGFDPADGDALFSTRHHNPIGLHEWVIARDLHTRLSRPISAEGK